MTIQFGTDGWRGLIAKDFTFDNVALVSHAVSITMKQKLPQHKTIIIGYDRRFLSSAFAETSACVFAFHGFHVKLTSNFTPTPVVAWTVKTTPGCAGGVMITASHNEYNWNGFKFKENFGGSACIETTQAFEKMLDNLKAENFELPQTHDLNHCLRQGTIEMFSPMESYNQNMASMFDIEKIRKKNYFVAIDSMYGAGSHHTKTFFESVGVRTVEIHSDENAFFNHTPPEPIDKNLMVLSKAVKEQNTICGLATDGDADRLGAIDEHGVSFSTQKILAVTYWHMLTHKNKKWNISRSVSTTNLVDTIANEKGFSCIETPVGFKNIAQNLLSGKAQIGGEESGGIGMVDHIMDRDGLFTAMMLLDHMATTDQTLSEIYANLCKQFRSCEFIRDDLLLSTSAMNQAIAKLKSNPPPQWLGTKVRRIESMDGTKFYLEDDSWILIRRSGTEPIFRLYAESTSLDRCQLLLAEVKKFITI